ncbi:hypothetical protein K2X33_09495 [bacterium]|nr:hypothetical protein [bacterium]
MNNRWSVILMGTVIALASMLGFTFLAAGLGMLSLPLDPNTDAFLGVGVGTAAVLAIGTFASYYLGGFVASRLHEDRAKGEACFQGLAVWGLACCVMGLVGLMGVTTLGAGTLALQAAQKTDPTVESDVHPLRAEVSSRLKLHESRPMTDQEKRNVEKAKTATAALSLGSFLAVLLSMIASATGGWIGRPTRKTAARHTFSREPIAA